MKKRTIILQLVLIALFLPGWLCSLLSAEMVDRIVVIVGDETILLSEYKAAVAERGDQEIQGTETDVLEGMIDTLLLMNEAKKYKLGFMRRFFITQTERPLIVKEYLDKRVRAFIHIPYEKIEAYYNDNREQFRERQLADVRDQIEAVFIEQEYEDRVNRHLKELRDKAYIRVQVRE